ncbi:site-specific DNA-methyltransferase [Microcoleus sp. S28C3]|uniref:site-specific DNA-methyltransferase n=1 Tax=Microcoleus sp. S28C3 TaxID=3055414 RepID=UPI002FD4E40A
MCLPFFIGQLHLGKNRASKEHTPHPAQFPVAVVDRIIKSASNLNEIVLDPFMGSGTTAIVALSLQGQAIGFEIMADYCDIEPNRVDDFLTDKELREAQLSLFYGW